MQNVHVDLFLRWYVLLLNSQSDNRTPGYVAASLHIFWLVELNLLTCSRLAEVLRTCKITPATLEPHIPAGKIITGTSALVSSCLPSSWTEILYYRYSGTSVSGTVLIFIKPTGTTYCSVDSKQCINTNHERTRWRTPDLYLCFDVEQNHVYIQQWRYRIKV